jgi:hypothetical protein
MKTAATSFDNEAKSKYVEMAVGNQNLIYEIIKIGLNSGNAC